MFRGRCVGSEMLGGFVKVVGDGSEFGEEDMFKEGCFGNFTTIYNL